MAPSDMPLTEHTVQADVALCLVLAANVLNIVAFVSHSWAVPHGKENQYGSIGYGLWKYCDSDKKNNQGFCGSLTTGKEPAWLKASQAMMVLGFICMILVMLTQLGYICVRSLSGRKNVVILFSLLCLPAAIFSLIGTVVYGTQMNGFVTEAGFTYAKLAWGFILANVAIGVVLLAGALGLAELHFNPKLNIKEEPMIALEAPVPVVEIPPLRY